MPFICPFLFCKTLDFRFKKETTWPIFCKGLLFSRRCVGHSYHAGQHLAANYALGLRAHLFSFWGRSHRAQRHGGTNKKFITRSPLYPRLLPFQSNDTCVWFKTKMEAEACFFEIYLWVVLKMLVSKCRNDTKCKKSRNLEHHFADESLNHSDSLFHYSCGFRRGVDLRNAENAKSLRSWYAPLHHIGEAWGYHKQPWCIHSEDNL